MVVSRPCIGSRVLPGITESHPYRSVRSPDNGLECCSGWALRRAILITDSSSGHGSVATAESVGDGTSHRTETLSCISQRIAFREGATDRGQADHQNGRHHQ
jgi:hypothetical protein